MTYAEDVALDDLVTISGGGTPSTSKPEYFTGTIPWVSPKDMKFWEIVTSQDKITEDAVANSTAKLIEPGAVLVVIRSGVLKHSLPVAINRVPVTVNQDLKALRCGERILPEFLARYLQANAQNILTNVRGTTADNIPTESLRQLRLSLPPLSEQKRIAEILDQAESLRAKRRAALALLDELTQSIFFDMFGDPRKRIASEGIDFGTVVDEFRYGTSNKSGANGFPALRIPNVIGASIDCSELKLVQVDDAEFSRLRLLHGDVLFVRTNGNPDNVGRCAVFEQNLLVDSGYDPEEFIYASYLIRARLKSSVLPIFIRELMLTSEGRKNTRATAKTSAGQYNINTHGLGSLPIFVPPIYLQQKFVDRVQVVYGLKAVLGKFESEQNQLFASLQHRAFRGEL